MRSLQETESKKGVLLLVEVVAAAGVELLLEVEERKVFLFAVGLGGGVEIMEVVAIEGTSSIFMLILMVGLDGLSLSTMAEQKLLCLALENVGLLGGVSELGISMPLFPLEFNGTAG